MNPAAGAAAVDSGTFVVASMLFQIARLAYRLAAREPEDLLAFKREVVAKASPRLIYT